MKRVLITGANSYIGDSVKHYLDTFGDLYAVDIKDTIGWNPSCEDFKGYDVVFNVAGIAHIKETKENSHLYYDINRDLAIKIAKTAKEAGIKQFILLSSMSVYGITEGFITKETPVRPTNTYGKSKAEADEAIFELQDNDFKFACLRPPMVYGKGCKGNYQSLRKFALKSPIFPDYQNRRSMVYIGNLCEFVKECIDDEKYGLYFPQNSEYMITSEMVKYIAENNDKKIRMVKCFNWLIHICGISVVKKVFGNLIYESVDMINKYSIEESIRCTEQ
ncbi:MAG: NAD-dependent epimerase/dehydratase family protein [Lachnospiraceae bacterium]|nr:NAD-dependent epimerase/dehydratase family protein [Lachnospiraceae bacterium]